MVILEIVLCSRDGDKVERQSIGEVGLPASNMTLGEVKPIPRASLGEMVAAVVNGRVSVLLPLRFWAPHWASRGFVFTRIVPGDLTHAIN